MTIENARKKLGKKAQRMSDEDIKNLLNFLTRIVNKAIDNTVR